MQRRVLVAKKRGRLVGALLGGVLAGPLGVLAGAVLNNKTDYYEDEPKPPAVARCLQDRNGRGASPSGSSRSSLAAR